MTDLVTFARDLAFDTKAYVTKTVSSLLEPVTARLVAVELALKQVETIQGPQGPAGESIRGEKGDAG